MGKILAWGKWVLRHIDVFMLLLITVVLLVLALTDTPQRRGDGNEYYLMMLSLANHRSTDLQSIDTDEYSRLRAVDKDESISFQEDDALRSNLSSGYIKVISGESHSIHFWLYSLLAALVMRLLRASGLDPLLGLQVTNALLLIFALAMALFYSGFDRFKRWLFSALILFSPAVWYLDWSGPEIFSFSLVVASIAAFSNNKHGLAVLLGALASTQNPPIVFLVLFYLIYAGVDIWQSRRFRRIPLVVAAAMPALAPTIYNIITFEVANPIYEVGAASLSVISLHRTWSFFVDLNQGILPFIPGVILFFIFLLVRNGKRKEMLIFEISLVILTMALLAQTTTNWNSDAEGIMRYAVWFLPLFIWGVVAGAHLEFKTDKICLAAVLVTEMIVVLSFPAWVIPQHTEFMKATVYLQHNAIARYVLDNHPSLYSPEQEIFAERTIKQEVRIAEHLPIIYSREDKTATKILTNDLGVRRLGDFGDVNPEFLRVQRDSHSLSDGIFYINLSPGDMQVFEH